MKGLSTEKHGARFACAYVMLFLCRVPAVAGEAFITDQTGDDNGHLHGECAAMELYEPRSVPCFPRCHRCSVCFTILTRPALEVSHAITHRRCSA